MTNKFFDSDTLLIQNQENNIINQITEIQPYKPKFMDSSYDLHDHPLYRMPASCDIPITNLRQFIKPYIHDIRKVEESCNKAFSEMKRDEILSRLDQHTLQCKYCKTSMKNTEFIKKYGTSILIVFYFVTKDFIMLFLALSIFQGYLIIIQISELQTL